MKKILALILLFGSSTIAMAASTPAQEQFAQANQAYEKNDLEKAGEIYSALLKQGYGGAALYYNMGNLMYRQGDRGKAVLWFERAKRLAPRDADIAFNLALSRSHLKDESPDWLENFVTYLNGNELAVIVSVLLWGFLILLGTVTLGWVRHEIWPGLALWTTGLFLVAFGTWLGVNAAWDARAVAIITNTAGEVRNGPGKDYAVGFTVPEGSSVLILNQRPEWTQVGVVKQGLKGWIPSTDIEPIKNPVVFH